MGSGWLTGRGLSLCPQIQHVPQNIEQKHGTLHWITQTFDNFFDAASFCKAEFINVQDRDVDGVARFMSSLKFQLIEDFPTGLQPVCCFRCGAWAESAIDLKTVGSASNSPADPSYMHALHLPDDVSRCPVLMVHGLYVSQSPNG